MMSTSDGLRSITFSLEKEFITKGEKNKRITSDFKNEILKKEILPYVCAFLNADNNKPSFIKFNVEVKVTPKEVDIFKKEIEDSIKDAFGITVLHESIKVSDEGKNFRFMVTSRPELSSIECNLYLPCEGGPMKLPSWCIECILPVINGWNKLESNTAIQEIEKTVPERFVFDNEFPAESKTIQFKYFPIQNPARKGSQQESQSVLQQKQDPPQQRKLWETLCDKIQKKHLTHYASAFANGKGGRIYYGIEDKERKIKGYKLSVEDRENVRKKIDDILSGRVYKDSENEKMKWGVTTEDDRQPEPEEEQEEQPMSQQGPRLPWEIEFKPVYARKEEDEQKDDTFVIVITVHPFPKGVFSKLPKSYKLDENKKPVQIKYTNWRKKMQDSYNWHESQIDQNARRESLKMINVLDNLVDSGKSTDRIIETLSNKEDKPDITLRIQIAFVHYRKSNTEKVVQCLQKVEELLYSEIPPVNRSVHELHYCSLKASFMHQQGNLNESLLITYECLEKAKRIIPGWESAIIWNTHGKTLADAACKEKSTYKRKERLDGAVRAWCQAITLACKVISWKEPKANEEEHGVGSIVDIIHSSHLYIALRYLGFTASGNVLDDPAPEITEEDREAVKKRIGAAESLPWKLSKYNDCLMLIVTSLLEPKMENKCAIETKAMQIPRIQRLVKKVLERLYL